MDDNDNNGGDGDDVAFSTEPQTHILNVYTRKTVYANSWNEFRVSLALEQTQIPHVKYLLLEYNIHRYKHNYRYMYAK